MVGILIWAALLVTSCGKAGPPPADDTTDPAATAGASERAVALVDLDDAGEVAAWTTVNDPVMGGMSTSRIAFGNGGLMFSGVISLENNGGFASARRIRRSGGEPQARKRFVFMLRATATRTW